MNTKISLVLALAVLVPVLTHAQDEPNPASPVDRQKLREELRNLSPEERQAKLRQLREQGGIAPAQRPMDGAMQPGFAGGVGRVLMVLTPEQRESMRSLSEADREKTRELEEKIRHARKAALDATLEPKLDEAALRQKLEAAAKLETELTILRAKALSKIDPPLSEEQIQKIKSGAPAAANIPPRRPPLERGKEGVSDEKLPYGNQPLPPPTNP